MAIRIVDITDDATFALVPPCANAGFDHRSCDYWENADRGSRAARSAWLTASAPSSAQRPARSANPFADDDADDEDAGGDAFNPFAPRRAAAPAFNPFATDDDEPAFNPFAPQPKARPAVGQDGLPKLRLLARGAGVFGSYAKVLLVDDEPAAYCQFGPLSAYPRAQRTRELYPRLPEAPLPAVITCLATTAVARSQGLARRLVEDVCADLAARGFAAVETYPEAAAAPDQTPSPHPDFWTALGFVIAAADDRYPVLRKELA